jgi:recombination protein RecA
VVKNKVAPPFKRVEVDILFGEGISKELDLLDAALHYNVIKQSGAWLSFGKEQLAQGREKCLKLLQEDKDLYTKVKDEVYKYLQESTNQGKVG